jgi:hypothetical protein
MITLARNNLRDNSYIIGTWAVLMALTTLSWWFGSDHGLTAISVKAGMSGVLVITFVKVLMVGHVFMEQRHAALALRVVFAGWCVVVCGALLAFYLAA